MATQEFDFDGDLWFFYPARRVQGRCQSNQHVNVSYAEPKKKYVQYPVPPNSCVIDRRTVESAVQSLVCKGLDEPDPALLKVSADKVEYWDSPSSKAGVSWDLQRRLVTVNR